MLLLILGGLVLLLCIYCCVSRRRSLSELPKAAVGTGWRATWIPTWLQEVRQGSAPLQLRVSATTRYTLGATPLGRAGPRTEPPIVYPPPPDLWTQQMVVDSGEIGLIDELPAVTPIDPTAEVDYLPNYVDEDADEPFDPSSYPAAQFPASDGAVSFLSNYPETAASFSELLNPEPTDGADDAYGPPPSPDAPEAHGDAAVDSWQSTDAPLDVFYAANYYEPE